MLVGIDMEIRMISWSVSKYRLHISPGYIILVTVDTEVFLPGS